MAGLVGQDKKHEMLRRPVEAPHLNHRLETCSLRCTGLMDKQRELVTMFMLGMLNCGMSLAAHLSSSQGWMYSRLVYMSPRRGTLTQESS